MKKNNIFKARGPERPQSQRQLSVSRQIMSAVVECIRRGKRMDLRLESMPLTITKVSISADLRIADCYFVPFAASHLSVKELQEALDLSKYTIRSYVTEAINLKYSPEIRFYYDHTLEHVAKIEELLKKL